jgi:hypothetical protein
MLVRERIDPRFDTPPGVLSHGKERRPSGAADDGRRREFKKALPVPLGRGHLWVPGRRRKRDAAAALAGIAVVAAIATNALVLQNGPHPAPIFAIRLGPVTREATGAVAQLPRPRASEAARPDPLQSVGGIPLPRPRPQSRPAGAMHADPIADMIDPGRRIRVVQRVLNDFGYGPIKVNGEVDRETKEGIERFERDHQLPVTGQNSPRLRQALAAATGRSLD